MDPRWLVACGLAALLGAGVATAAPTPENVSTEKAAPPAKPKALVPEFADVGADVDPEDGGIVMMQRNNGSGRVQIVAISHDFHLKKQSWTDKPGPRADVNASTRVLSVADQGAMRDWMTQLWKLAGKGKGGHLTYQKGPPDDDGKPAFLYAFVLRRGAEVRIVDVGAHGVTKVPPPDWIDGVVDYMEMEF